jgi:hypothetical protein
VTAAMSAGRSSSSLVGRAMDWYGSVVVLRRGNAAGSGVLLRPDLVLTTAHVVDPAGTHALAADVDGIIGPKTWERLKGALSPPTSLTGIVAPGMPPVPNGMAEVIAAFGDPRAFLSADGSITPDNENAWQRQTLSKGTLPFGIPLDPQQADPDIKATFYAHRKLVGVFEAVFEEISRLGLRQYIRSWGGIYNFRPIRGTTSSLSLHCFGAAIDLNSETNALGTAGDMNPGIVDVFEHFGFFWGGKFRGRPDPMHFQYATGG